MTKKGRCLEAQSGYVLTAFPEAIAQKVCNRIFPVNIRDALPSLIGTVSGQARRGGGCADFASSSRPWIAAFLEFDDLAGRAAKTAILWQIVDISEEPC